MTFFPDYWAKIFNERKTDIYIENNMTIQIRVLKSGNITMEKIAEHLELFRTKVKFFALKYGNYFNK